MLIIYLLMCNSVLANATITRSNGTTYCASEYGGNFIINWKDSTITIVLSGSDTYKIIKESIDRENSEIVFTARKYFDKKIYTEFKIFSTSSGDYFRAFDNNAMQYQYHPARLLCWNEK